ncbi:MAG: glucose-1-phosphate thymidylyltransferase [Bacillaceae bacterium]|nr:glucose-1-phosphate thymidylyltransferase [Bacillaceae bacterium]
MKGLILCAGKGTRMQPLSFSQPKTMLPVANRPVLFYCIENLVSHGITDIGIVIHPSQKSVKDAVGDGRMFQARITYIEQHELKGIGHAVLQAKSFIGSDPFVLMLGDNLVMEPLQELIVDFESHRHYHASILLAEVENPQDFGIATVNGNEIVNVEEKPANPQSNLAVIGIYLFQPVIFDALSSISPSARGEYEITDAIQWLIDHDYAITFSKTGRRYFDVGTVDRWLKANQWMLSQQLHQDSQIGKDVQLDNCVIRGPVIIGEYCHIKDSVVGPYVSVESHARIEGCDVENSIILTETTLRHPGRISNSVFGRSSRLEGTVPEKFGYQLVLGDKSIIKISGDRKQKDR